LIRMGDWCGSVKYCPGTDKKEITGAKKGDNKARLCWNESERTSEKKVYFFGGRAVFFLDRPFNG